MSDQEKLQKYLEEMDSTKGEYSKDGYSRLQQLTKELEDYLNEDDVGALFVAGRILEELGKDIQEHATQVWKRDTTIKIIRESLQQEATDEQEEVTNGL